MAFYLGFFCKNVGLIFSYFQNFGGEKGKKFELGLKKRFSKNYSGKKIKKKEFFGGEKEIIFRVGTKNDKGYLAFLGIFGEKGKGYLAFLGFFWRKRILGFSWLFLRPHLGFFENCER